jgi:hypothetical protein
VRYRGQLAINLDYAHWWGSERKRLFAIVCDGEVRQLSLAIYAIRIGGNEDGFALPILRRENNCDITPINSVIVVKPGENSIPKLTSSGSRAPSYFELGASRPNRPHTHEILDRVISLPARVCANLVHQRDEDSHHE